MISTENNQQEMEGLTKGEQCRNIRQMLGLNQSEFAALVGVSKNVESNWENGYYEPNETRWKIIKALPGLKTDTNEELQLSFLKILPLCPRCRKIVEDYIR